jgi:UDPglucose 6-dehydrogenase
LGVTYKPGTSTLRRSLPLEIVDLLMKKGARVAVYDPKADYDELAAKPEFAVSPNIEKLSNGADMLLLLTEWPDFRAFDWTGIPSKMKRPIFFDTKNFLSEREMTDQGFHYYVVGRQ